MPNLALDIDCTACGACAFRCPKGCIHMQEDAIGNIYPRVNLSVCVECHACEKVCPIINPVSNHSTQECYAAWINDPIERSTSASGGVAFAIYKNALKRGYVAIGASQNTDWSVSHKIALNLQDVIPFKNSKYTFSHAYNVYPQVNFLLKAKKQVVMIGLPCQIAAMRSLFGENENLLLIDIVCHGSTPTAYLQQHIHAIEEIMQQKAAGMSFRAPEKGTVNYFFALYNTDGEIFYSKRSIDGDSYNIAFHRAISYRESCYRCHFARPDRVSDITLGDFHGLGKMQPCTYTEEKVSTILIQTEKGRTIIDSMIKEGVIYAEQRPIMEPVQGDSQLRHASIKTQPRFDFEKYICLTNGNFELAISKVQRQIKKRERISQFKAFPKRVIKKLLRILRFS